MFKSDYVTVVTATTGHRDLLRCLKSVQAQSYRQVEHLVVVDGPEHQEKVAAVLAQLPAGSKPPQVIQLPQATGKNGWCGHRIYAAASFLANSEFVAFLDEDNWYDADHVESLVSALRTANARWAFSLRKIVDKDGAFIANDLCESLGNLHGVFSNPEAALVDTSCYLLTLELAVGFASVWFGPTQPGPGGEERDWALCKTLLQYAPEACTNLKHTLNYTVGNRANSVQGAYFLHGNEEMCKRYPDGMPWEKVTLPGIQL